MSMDAIHVHTEKGGEHGKIKGNTTLETNDCLWELPVHESWCCAKPPFALNRWPQEGQGMWGHKGEDHMIDIGNLLVGVVGEAEKGPMN
jgi:hypothetical protein